MSNPSPPGAAGQMPVIRASRDDTLRGLAARLYKDERAVELLALANPGVPSEGKLAEGTPVRLPDKATTQKWAQKKGITLGVDPSKSSGTRQKRAWKSFQTGPSNKIAVVTIGVDAPIVQLLAVPGPGVTGAGLLT